MANNCEHLESDANQPLVQASAHEEEPSQPLMQDASDESL